MYSDSTPEPKHTHTSYQTPRSSDVKRSVGRPRTDPRLRSKRLQRVHDLKDEKAAVDKANELFRSGRLELAIELATSTLHTKVGRKDFSFLLPNVFATAVTAGTIEALGNVKGGNRQELVGNVSAHLSVDLVQQLAEEVSTSGGKPLTAKYIIKARRENSTPGPMLTQLRRREKKRITINLNLSFITKGFFETISAVPSGSRTSTRLLAYQLHEVKVQFFARFPALLRDFAKGHPDVLKALHIVKESMRTRFDRSLLNAVDDANKANFDQAAELHARTQEADARWTQQLTYKRLAYEGYTCDQVKRIILARQDDDQINPQATAETVIGTDSGRVFVPTMPTFWRILRDAGIRWSTNVNPTECPIHDKGPGWKLAADKATKDLADAQAALAASDEALASLKEHEEQQRQDQEATSKHLRIKIRELMATGRELHKNVESYLRHLEQYKTCRKVIKEIEAGLKPNEAVMYRDFVAQYNCDGCKIANLVFVVIFRQTVDSDRGTTRHQVFKINHFCHHPDERSADRFYVAAVMKLQLQAGGFMKTHGIDRLYISGDHGPHFAAIATFFDESTMFDRFQVDVHVFFLCSYHAYNRCDGAGVESKKLANVQKRLRKGLRTARDYAEALNASNYDNSVGHSLPQIDRSDIVFPTTLVEKMAKPGCDESAYLRGLCEFR